MILNNQLTDYFMWVVGTLFGAFGGWAFGTVSGSIWGLAMGLRYKL